MEGLSVTDRVSDVCEDRESNGSGMLKSASVCFSCIAEDVEGSDGMLALMPPPLRH